jgi:hypothetical protein
LAGFLAATFFLAGAFLALGEIMAHILPPCGPARKIRNTRFKQIDITAGTGVGV